MEIHFFPIPSGLGNLHGNTQVVKYEMRDRSHTPPLQCCVNVHALRPFNAGGVRKRSRSTILPTILPAILPLHTRSRGATVSLEHSLEHSLDHSLEH
jgi:hypothetical protein